MSIKVFAYFEKENLPKLMQALRDLKSCNAKSIGEFEKPKESDIALEDSEQVQSFLIRHSEGFFMHSNRGLYDVSLYEGTFSTVCFFSNGDLKEECISNILNAYASADAEFGYAADEQEYEYRNRIKLDISGSEVESWVGRDLTRYLPGLYYFTLISHRQVEQKSVDTETLKVNALSCTEVSDKATLYKFYDNSTQWESFKSKIDQLCRLNKGIFSKDDVEEVALKASNVMDFIMKTRQWS